MLRARVTIFFLIAFCPLTVNVKAMTDFPADSVSGSKKIVIGNISLAGNRVTRSKIILRELTFSENDCLSIGQLNEKFELSRENLLKTSLFNYVYIDTVTDSDNRLGVNVRLEERWYTWPEIYLNHADRNFTSWWQTKDFGRLYYGLGVTRYNFRGRQEKISARMITGFTSLLSFAYHNIYLDEQRRHSIDLEAFFENQNRLDYSTENNEIQQFKSDNRIYRKTSYYFTYNYRHRLYASHQLLLMYYNYNISDTVLSLNSNYLGELRKKLEFSGLSYIFEYDRRDLKYYPLKGRYFNCQFSYFGLFNKGINKFEVKTGYFHFFELFPRYYASMGLKTQIENKKDQPYVLTEALGYKDFLRGFDNYVIDGHNFLLFKSTLKYEVLPTKIINLKFLPFSQFNKVHLAAYISLFFDAGYVHDYYNNNVNHNNTLVDQGLITFGAGIDLVTYYDKMLRFDLAHNKLDGWGFYLNLNQNF